MAESGFSLVHLHVARIAFDSIRDETTLLSVAGFRDYHHAYSFASKNACFAITVEGMVPTLLRSH